MKSAAYSLELFRAGQPPRSSESLVDFVIRCRELPSRYSDYCCNRHRMGECNCVDGECLLSHKNNT
jgi:hypothetical protein